MAALEACAATLCCGPVYDPSNLNGGGDIYLWLCKLLNCHNDKVGGFGRFGGGKVKWFKGSLGKCVSGGMGWVLLGWWR